MENFYLLKKETDFLNGIILLIPAIKNFGTIITSCPKRTPYSALKDLQDFYIRPKNKTMNLQPYNCVHFLLRYTAPYLPDCTVP
jgi:hypothetical protein